MSWIDDQLLITQKSGEIFLVNTNDYSQTKIDHNIPFVQHGQGGLLDISLDIREGRYPFVGFVLPLSDPPLKIIH